MVAAFVFTPSVPRALPVPLTTSCQGTGVIRPPILTIAKFTVPDGLSEICCSTPIGAPVESVMVVGVTLRNKGAFPPLVWFVLIVPNAGSVVDAPGCVALVEAPVGFVATPWFAGLVVCPVVG